MVSGWASGQREKVCPGCISETVRCRKLILGRTLVRMCRRATSWCDLDLTFDLAIVTLTYNIFYYPPRDVFALNTGKYRPGCIFFVHTCAPVLWIMSGNNFRFFNNISESM